MNWFELIGGFDLWGLSVPLPVALAAVATIGYVMGRRKYASEHGMTPRSKREFRRARCVARELEKIARTVRQNISRHHSSVVKFKQRVGALSEQEQAAAWEDLCREAEAMLVPTLQLANQIATAYDQIRQQSNNLMTFTEVRTDPLTGISNRRGLETALQTQLALMNRFGNGFSLAIFDVDGFKQINDDQGHLEGDRLLRHIARQLDNSLRDTDIVGRYGGEEFVAVLPQTGLDGACAYAERLHRELDEELPLTVSVGVTTALDGDNVESLLARLDAALYAAKSAGGDGVFLHDGELVEPLGERALAEAGV